MKSDSIETNAALPTPMDIDDFDRRLLAALQRDNRQTGEQLAELAGLSPAACLRRVQRLRDAGIIERDVSILSPDATGNGLTAIVLVTIERDRLTGLDSFKHQMTDVPEVTQCYYVTGSADYVLIMAVPDMPTYQAFTQKHFMTPNVKRFETLMVMSRLKFETALPLA
jgi:Lrp/AsnC family leucine-responsive transcriptional regulator